MPISAEAELPDFSRPMAEAYDALPDTVRDALPDGIWGSGGPDAARLSEELRPEAWFSRLREALLAGLPGAGRMLGQLVLICVLSALSGQLAAAFGRGKAVEAVQICTTVFSALLLLEEEAAMLETLTTCLRRLQVTVNAFLPLLGGLFAAGGSGAVSASGCGGLLMSFALLENLCTALLLPMLAACLGLSALAGLSIGRRLGGLLACMKRLVGFLLGLFGVMFSAVFGLQSILAVGADSVAARTVKFAVGSAVPVIGGVMGDTVRTVGAGLEYLKDTVGVFGVFLTLLLILPPLLQVLLHRAVLLIGRAVGELLGCEGESRLMGEFASISGWMLALLCGCAAAFIFALVLFVRITLAMAA